jgi:hypothetical protein
MGLHECQEKSCKYSKTRLGHLKRHCELNKHQPPASKVGTISCTVSECEWTANSTTALRYHLGTAHQQKLPAANQVKVICLFIVNLYRTSSAPSVARHSLVSQNCDNTRSRVTGSTTKRYDEPLRRRLSLMYRVSLLFLPHLFWP